MMNRLDKPKVLFTASVYSHLSHFHRPYLEAFQRLGWEVHIACADAPESVPFAQRVIGLPLQKKMWAPENFHAARLLRAAARAERYHLVVTHTSLAAFFTRLGLRGLRQRPPLVNMVHGYLFDDASPPLRRGLLLSAERLCAAETDLLLTMNAYDDALARRCHLGRRVARVPGVGVDFSRLARCPEGAGAALRGEWQIPREARVLLYAAEFSKRKSQSVLIQALAHLPEDYVLVLCGQGELWEDCRALAQHLGLGARVCFPGQADMGPWYQACDAVAASSRSEGLPFNLMEAQYLGLPVVASDVKGHSDLIAHGETGLLYPYGDAAACARAVTELFSDPARYAALSHAARQRAMDYRLERVQPLVMAQYLSLVESDAVHDMK